MTLTKAELSDLIFEKLGLNKTEAKDFVEVFFEEIRICLEKGEDVKLSGFGNFQLRDKSQRPGRGNSHFSQTCCYVSSKPKI